MAAHELFSCVLRAIRLFSFVYIATPEIFRIILIATFVSLETVLLALVSWKLRNFRKILTRESIINVAGFLRYASETSYYKKLKNTQLSDNVNNNEKLVEQFFEGPFFRRAILQGETFRGGGNFPETIFCCSGGNFSGGFFPRCILPNTVVMYHYLERLNTFNFSDISLN